MSSIVNTFPVTLSTTKYFVPAIALPKPNIFPNIPPKTASTPTEVISPDVIPFLSILSTFLNISLSFFESWYLLLTSAFF